MSIFDTIGGESFVHQAVGKFYRRLVNDPVLADHFQTTDVAKLESHQRMFLTAALGGPDAYEGRDMRAAHAHLPVSDADFDRFLGHLADTLAEVGAPPDRVNAIVDALAPLRVEIVHAAQDGPDEWGSTDPSGGSG